MSLLEELGLDPDEFVWQDLALCANMDTNLFYDEYETNQVVRTQVDEICSRCPVQRECLLTGHGGEIGVWGGVYWNGNGKPDRARNEHKPEGWREEIAELML